MTFYRILLSVGFLLGLATVSRAEFRGWAYSGSIWLITTPEGADLPASASLENFPVLVRLAADNFDFSQARPDGSDLRFSAAGVNLPYEIESWDAQRGSAAMWVRVPLIKGNDRQELKIQWGNPTCAAGSDSKSVFNATNGYVSVWHLGDTVNDATGFLPAKDTGTTATPGVVAIARHFAGKQGIFGGDKIVGLPSGAASHSTEAWFRAERSNATIIGWGNEGGGRGTKVRMQFRSPPHIKIDSAFADVVSESRLPMNEWIHVVHTYSRGQGRLYINGKLDGSAKPLLDFKSPARFWIGGWYNDYDFVGDIDEVRVSSVERSADWVRLEYENQKPLQTLVGPVVQPGVMFDVVVTSGSLTIDEGKSVTFLIRADGAQRLYWTRVESDQETVLATNAFKFEYKPGRVSGDTKQRLRVHAIYANGATRSNLNVVVKEAIPDPQFTLAAPPTWDGRTPIDVEVKLKNAEQLKAAGVEPKFTWDALTFAVTTDSQPGKLRLLRAQNSGKLKVSATGTTGGECSKQTVEIAVTEPATDPWLARQPADDERPVDNQFYARDDKNEGTLHCRGKLADHVAGDRAFLHVYVDGGPHAERSADVGPDGRYDFAVKLRPGLMKYRTRFGVLRNGEMKVLETADNLVCGDAYLIDGQSNAEATAWGKEEYPFTSTWIRTFGNTTSDPKGARLVQWGDAVARGKGGVLQVGCWGMELGRRLVEDQKMPICLINGAVGGTRIDQHQRNAADPEDAASIYGRLLWRVRRAGLSHGIKAVLWHQGENDQGADGPTGGFGYETYRRYFLDMAAAWKRDYPNVQHYYVFQIWPKSCAMGINGSDNRLREVQRMLSRDFSKLSVMSTLGIDPPGGCHYPPAGYAEMARLICPLIERDFYGKAFENPVTPPDLKRASFNAARDRIVLEFDQPVVWNEALKDQFYLDGERGKIASGEVAGNRLTLKLSGPSQAKTITYLDSKAWNPKMLLRGTNGIAALTFCEVGIEAETVK